MVNITSLCNKDKNHFLGSIIRFDFNNVNSEIPQYLIIDGQQRITTILLVILAIIANTNKSNRKNELLEDYIINKGTKNNYKYKLISNVYDQNTLSSIIDQILDTSLDNNLDHTNLVNQNFKLFKKLVADTDSDNIWYTIRKLVIVDIKLNNEIDKPQLIFEYINSTGIPLCPADLIRNYILMQFSPKEQTDIYKSLWAPMEQNFKQDDFNTVFNDFCKQYLISKSFKKCDHNKIYEEFKLYIDNEASKKNLIKDMKSFSNYYINLADNTEPNPKIKKIISDINILGRSAHLPFLLNVYRDYNEKIISENNFLEILNVIESLLFRRIICNIPSNLLTTLFIKLYKYIDKNYYVDSIQHYLNKDFIFPNDNKFKESLLTKNIYKTQTYCKYFLIKLENFNRKEPIEKSNYTIEHIMPITLPSEWQESLGENYENIHSEFLHTIGNLTLTGYNSELSNKSFIEKLKYFKTSPLWLNSLIVENTKWNQETIINRCEKIFNRAIKIWPSLTFSEEYKKHIQDNKVKSNDENTYSLILEQPLIKQLYNAIKEHILKLNSNISEKFLKNYIAYQINTSNFVSLVPRTEKIEIFLNLKTNNIKNNIIPYEDYSNIGHWGTGDVKVTLNNLNEINDIMELIKLAYNKVLKI